MRLNDSSDVKILAVSGFAFVTTVLLDWSLLSAVPFADANTVPATIAAPTENWATGFVIVPACLPTRLNA